MEPPETRSRNWVCTLRKERPTTIDALLEEYFATESDLGRLERAMGWIARFINGYVKRHRRNNSARTEPFVGRKSPVVKPRKKRASKKKEGEEELVESTEPPVLSLIGPEFEFVPGRDQRQIEKVELRAPGEPFLLGKAVKKPKDLEREYVYSKELDTTKELPAHAMDPVNRTVSVNTLRSQSASAQVELSAPLPLQISLPNDKVAATSPLTPDELAQGRRMLIRAAQLTGYAEEMCDLKAGRPIKRSSKLIDYTPYLDENGLMRVGGRLHNAELPELYAHPYILPYDHPLTAMIIRQTHVRVLHGAINRTWGEIRKEYFFLKHQRTIGQYVHTCHLCRKRDARPKSPMMASLPHFRVCAPAYPFEHTGVDCFGPFDVTYQR